MLNRLLFVVLIIGMVSLTGCLTKPAALVETAATSLVRPDSSFWTFLGYGPWSDEFDAGVEYDGAMYRSNLSNLRSNAQLTDKYFFLYDVNDPNNE